VLMKNRKNLLDVGAVGAARWPYWDENSNPIIVILL
jgi:hypothetical protein